MTNLEWSWPEATIAACGLAVVTFLLRLARRPRLTATAMFAQETALVLALFALWQFAGSFSVMGPGGALGRGRWIWHLDRVRTALVALTGACLLIQLIPVAPPRMLPGTGLVDTAVLYHQSVYAAHTGFEADQLSAMPSVHVGWAILVAIMVITAARSPWRWLALLYPVLTTLAVVVTANHFWLDGIVAGLLLALVLLVQYAISRAAARYRHMRLLPYLPAWD